MKYIWQEKDIVVGQWVGPSVYSESKFIQCITWHSNRGTLSNKQDNIYGVCYIATDGLALDLGSKQDVADYLNKNNYKPVNKANLIHTPRKPQSKRV